MTERASALQPRKQFTFPEANKVACVLMLLLLSSRFLKVPVWFGF